MAQQNPFSLTFQQLQDEAAHAVGGTPDARAPVDRIVNGAMEYLFNCHDWSWRETIGTLDFTSGVGQIVLPSDFAELIDLVGFNARYTAVRKGQWRDVTRIRVYGLPDQHILIYAVGAGGQYQAPNPTVIPAMAGATINGAQLQTGTYYARFTWLGLGGGETAGGPEQAFGLSSPNNAIAITVPAAPAGAGNANVYVGTTLGGELLAGSVAGGGTLNVTALPASSAQPFPQANTTSDPTVVPRKVLEVAPIPAASQVQALYLTYRRAAPVMVNPSDVPAVPYGFLDLLRTLVRACAVSSTASQRGEDWMRFNDQLPLYRNADAKAAGEQGDQMIDALNLDDGLYALRPWLSIKTPYDP